MWHSSARDYLATRINAVDSPLPQAEKDNVIGFVWDIVSAQQTKTCADEEQATIYDFMALYARKRGRQALPAAMRAAYKKYNLTTPEMIAEGFICTQCGIAETASKKHKSCACRADGVRYCGTDCQRAHWRRVHRMTCVRQGGTHSEKEEGAAAVAARLSGLSLMSAPGGACEVGYDEKKPRCPSTAALERLPKDANDFFIPPVFGTEDYEAWKLVMVSLLTTSSNADGQIEQRLRAVIALEHKYWEQFPNNPNWKLGTGPSTQAEMNGLLYVGEAEVLRTLASWRCHAPT